MQTTLPSEPSGSSFTISALNRRSASFSSPQDLTGAGALFRFCLIHVTVNHAVEKVHVLLYHLNLVVLSFKLQNLALMVTAGSLH